MWNPSGLRQLLHIQIECRSNGLIIFPRLSFPGVTLKFRVIFHGCVMNALAHFAWLIRGSRWCMGFRTGGGFRDPFFWLWSEFSQEFIYEIQLSKDDNNNFRNYRLEIFRLINSPFFFSRIVSAKRKNSYQRYGNMVEQDNFHHPICPQIFRTM